MAGSVTDERYLYDMFKCYLEFGEQILLVFGTENSAPICTIDEGKLYNKTSWLGKFHNVVFVILILIFVFIILNGVFSVSSEVLLYIAMTLIPVGFIAIAVINIFRSSSKTDKPMNCAITDRRIIWATDHLEEAIDLSDVSKVDLIMINYEIGDIIMTAEINNIRRQATVNFTLAKVKDPLKVRDIIKEAVANCQSDSY